MSQLTLQLQGFRLATAEILYHLPDYPTLLQSYIWQEYDQTPDYPELVKFLEFWEKNLDGRLHSVKVTSTRMISDREVACLKHGLSVH